MFSIIPKECDKNARNRVKLHKSLDKPIEEIEPTDETTLLKQRIEFYNESIKLLDAKSKELCERMLKVKSVEEALTKCTIAAEQRKSVINEVNEEIKTELQTYNELKQKLEEVQNKHEVLKEAPIVKSKTLEKLEKSKSEKTKTKVTKADLTKIKKKPKTLTPLWKG